jgi:putative salt-induced outer membrane protein
MIRQTLGEDATLELKELRRYAANIARLVKRVHEESLTMHTDHTHRLCCASLFAFTILGALPGLAHGQALPPPPPQREGSAEFAFVGTTGNSSTQTIGLGGEYIYRPSPWETRLRISYVRNEAEDQLKAQAFLLTLRVQRPIRPRLSGYGQYGYQRDRFAGILDRNTIEAGVAYSLIEQAPHKLIVDGSLGYANEKRLLGNNLSTATLGAGGAYTLKISGTSELSEDGHFVFSLSDGNDWRYANAVALTAKVTTLLSLKVSNIFRYVNQPVVGFKGTDAITAIALVAKF